ncbi:MAG: ribonuclease E/G, partial [Aestuariivirga sp.]
LAGLVVIDFIDMEENRNNRNVERRLKDALKNDRARIQVGRISHFGLMEMSRQRLRPGLLEGSSRPCPHCEGRGIVRSISSCGLSVLRAIEEHLISRKAEHLTVKCTREVASYVLNEKRDNLLIIEQAYGISVFIVPSDEVKGSQAVIERAGERTAPVRRIMAAPVKIDSAYEDDDVVEEDSEAEVESEASSEEQTSESSVEAENGEEGSDSQRGRRRRRGRRGGRRGGRDREDQPQGTSAPDEEGETPRHQARDDEGSSESEETSAPVEAGSDSAAEEPSEKEGGERGHSRRRDRWGRNRNGRHKNGRNVSPDADSNGHGASAAEPRESQPERQVERVFERPVERQPERQVTPIIAIQEIPAPAVEPRKWQPPAPTVSASDAAAKPKAGWWSKRG